MNQNKSDIELAIITAIKEHHFDCGARSLEKYDARYIKKLGLFSAIGVVVSVFLSCGILYGMFWLGGKMENHEQRLQNVEHRIVLKN